MAVKKKLRIKKKVLYLGVFLLIFLLVIGVSIFLGTKYYKEKKYKETNEYKLIEHGYSLEEASDLLHFFNEEEIKSILEIEKNTFIPVLIKEKYYLNKNLERYLDYFANHKEITTSEIVALVNVNRDMNDYEKQVDCNLDYGILINVNKYYTLPENYIPDNLTDISNRYAYANHKIIKEANDAYVALWQAAKEDGLTLIVNSSFRTHEAQEKMYNQVKNTKGTKVADKTVARPGNSEHQTGLSIDIFDVTNVSMTNYKETEVYSWLQENAYKYGFIERYPEGKENITGNNPEAYHWRYVGIEAAKTIHEENITFDEYYAYYVEKS